VDGELSLARWVEVNSTTPARMFGLYPRKGTIAPGSDADIVVYDPALRHVLSAETHHMAVDYSAYEGREVQGGVSTVLSRGEILVSDGQWHGQAGRGQFLPRGASQYLR
jgi:dihydropyrimidinase